MTSELFARRCYMLFGYMWNIKCETEKCEFSTIIKRSDHRRTIDHERKGYPKNSRRPPTVLLSYWLVLLKEVRNLYEMMKPRVCETMQMRKKLIYLVASFVVWKTPTRFQVMFKVLIVILHLTIFDRRFLRSVVLHGAKLITISSVMNHPFFGPDLFSTSKMCRQLGSFMKAASSPAPHFCSSKNVHRAEWDCSIAFMYKIHWQWFRTNYLGRYLEVFLHTAGWTDLFFHSMKAQLGVKTCSAKKQDPRKVSILLYIAKTSEQM